MNTISLSSRIGQIDFQIQKLEEEIRLLPKGKFSSHKSGQYFKWFIMNKGQRIYLPKSKIELAKPLAYKEYLLAKIEDLQKEKSASLKYIGIYDTESTNLDQLLKNRDIKNLIIDYIKDKKPLDILSWSTAEYKRNTYHNGGQIHKSISGNVLRSKSEATIDAMLFQSNIPYRYECELTIEDQTFYPDFTIKHPQTESLIYWEHFGLIDVPKYQESFLKKLSCYMSHGILPGKNLIMTFETATTPLSNIEVEELINRYLK